MDHTYAILDEILPAALCILLGVLWLEIRQPHEMKVSVLLKVTLLLTAWEYLCLNLRSLSESLQIDLLIDTTNMKYGHMVVWAWTGNICVLTLVAPVGAWCLRRLIRLPILDWLVAVWVAAALPQAIQLLKITTAFGRQLIW